MRKTGITQIGIDCKDDVSHIRVWAPNAKQVNCFFVQKNLTLPLEKREFGYWYGESSLVESGDQYKIEIDGASYPDPASRCQPEGVHGPSEVVNLKYPWTDHAYVPPVQDKLIIYELHVGTFSATHDFAGVIAKIPHLKDLGINAIEIMPISQFPGERNWGYDGVFSFAVQHSYGGVRGLQQLVDACHAANIAVILDVVYNHFGPEGNYLPHFGPYFTDKYHTPWGNAVNYDDQLNYGIRDFVLANVTMWMEQFHIDGLRMDAVHAIKDFGAVHLLQEIRLKTDHIISKTAKKRYLFVECDLNDRRFLDPLKANGFAMDAQWLDEFHHALRVSVGEPKIGYYEEFSGINDLAKSYEKAYVFDGCYSSHRQKFFGGNADGITGDRFIVFSQNHDQIGNRMLGERSAALYSRETTRLMALAVFMSPYIPLLFMGEEWGTKRPFQYFVSHGDPTLVEHVREGRKSEFAAFHQQHKDIPDPQDRSTFQCSVLDWDELKKDVYSEQLSYYKSLISLRSKHIIWKNIQREDLQIKSIPEKKVLIIIVAKGRDQLLALLNFSEDSQVVSMGSNVMWQLICDTNTMHLSVSIEESQNLTGDIEIKARSGLVFQQIGHIE